MSTARLENLRGKIFADSADLEGNIDLYPKPFIESLTTSPTLIRKVGSKDYTVFARSVLGTGKPTPLEVFFDEFPGTRRQALKIRDWQDKVYVKIPISKTRAKSSLDTVRMFFADAKAAGFQL
jgi:transaldolase